MRRSSKRPERMLVFKACWYVSSQLVGGCAGTCGGTGSAASTRMDVTSGLASSSPPGRAVAGSCLPPGTEEVVTVAISQAKVLLRFSCSWPGL